MARAGTLSLAGISLRVARVEDLIVMKALAQRPRDLRDIEGLDRLLAARPRNPSADSRS